VSIELFDLSAVGDDRYRVSLRVAGADITYLVSVAEQPLPTVSAPHSFWKFLADNKVASKQVAEAIFAVRRGTSVVLPQPLQMKVEEDEPSFAKTDLWRSRSSSWHLSDESLKWAATHIVKQKNNTLFPVPFEHFVIAERIEEFRPIAQALDVCTHEFRDHRQILAPKASSSFRVAIQLDPLDCLLYSAATFELGEWVEAARIPVSEEIVYGFRFQPLPDGTLWDPQTSYEAFQNRTRDLLTASDTQFVAATDISAFYDRITAQLVGRALERIGINGKIAHAVTTLLESNAKKGLPVGPSASALFAEAILSPIDWHLRAKGIHFIRFNDDYRFFCPSEAAAQGALQLLIDSLWSTAGLGVQDAKTRVSTRADYLKTFESDGWLERLKRNVLDAMYDADVLEAKPIDQRLIASAQSLLQRSVDVEHVAWVRLCKTAFSALPLDEKRAALPILLDQLGRVSAIAPQVGQSLEALLNAGAGDRDLLALVRESITEQSQFLSDYAATWLLHAFRLERWPDRESLASLDSELTPSLAVARRELLVALHGTDAAWTVRHDRTNPWQHRAHVWATNTQDLEPPSTSDSPLRRRWVSTLYDALAGKGS
jgi:hypothetical protein